MSIGEYVKSDNQQDWIDFIIESLHGSCGSLGEYEDEYLEKGFDLDELLTQLDDVTHCCDCCGWWVDAHEMDENHYCNDCSEE